jgi:hypothetical protein
LTNQLSPDGTILPAFQTWVVESNRVRKIQDVDDTVDIEVEVSPFIRGNTDPTNLNWEQVLEHQAEICLGKRNEYSGWPSTASLWTEQEQGVDGEVEFIDLTILGSSNQVFPDMFLIMAASSRLWTVSNTARVMRQPSISLRPQRIIS